MLTFYLPQPTSNSADGAAPFETYLEIKLATLLDKLVPVLNIQAKKICLPVERVNSLCTLVRHLVK